MQNIEFKAELRDIDAARAQCRALGGERVGILEQTDTYYRLTDGRLKRRETVGKQIEWVYYHRPDRVSPKMSNFTLLTDEQARRRWGTHSLTAWLTVCKRRELWMIDSVRVHLDEVEQLGDFIEFEAPVSRILSVHRCYQLIGSLREAFGPALGEHISVSYSDLMQQLEELPERTSDSDAGPG